MKYWEIIAGNLSASGWSWGCVSAIDSRGRTIWIADGSVSLRGRMKKLTAFLELKRVTGESSTPDQVSPL